MIISNIYIFAWKKNYYAYDQLTTIRYFTILKYSKRKCASGKTTTATTTNNNSWNNKKLLLPFAWCLLLYLYIVYDPRLYYTHTELQFYLYRLMIEREYKYLLSNRYIHVQYTQIYRYFYYVYIHSRCSKYKATFKGYFKRIYLKTRQKKNKKQIKRNSNNKYKYI